MNAIEPHAVVARSAVATLVLITAAAAVAAWAVLVAVEVFREEEVVDFEEVAVADGDVGRIRERRLLPDARAAVSFGEVSREGA